MKNITGMRIKERRTESGLTLEALARLSGVTRQTIQRYESGVIKNIPSDRVECIAKALETTPEYLMGWKTSETEMIKYREEVKMEDKQEKLITYLMQFVKKATSGEASAAEIEALADVAETLRKLLNNG